MENKTILLSSCFPNSSGSAVIILSSLALPFHVLLIKLLVKDIGLALPRHQIMLTLSISDALQMFSGASLTVVGMALQLTTESHNCGLLRNITVFTSSLTVVVSSLAVVTFAVERMIICMHFLKYRRTFKKTRTTKLLCGYWFFGTVIAVTAALTNDARKAETSINETTSFQIVCASVILPSAGIIIFIYSRIFVFSRKKFTQVAPSPDNSKLRTVRTFKQKQLQIAYVAGIVCIAYVVCTVPMSMAFLLELTNLIENRPNAKKVLISMAMLNTIADPFIYGLGMIQTRKMLIRIMKRIFLCSQVSSV